MKDVHAVAGISKQAVHQHRVRQLQRSCKTDEFIEKANKLRAEHPRLGCRKMALDLRCNGWGRDKIEHLLLKNGFKVYYPPNYRKTTRSQHNLLYPNLIEGLELTGINQVVQTDFTYFRLKEKFYYLVFMIDVYSRRIVGYSVCKNLKAEGNIRALKMLFKTRKGCSLKGMIHHSDRGRQYIDTVYRAMLRDAEIAISMSKAAWENAYTERINRTIKEEYLDGWDITDYASLKRCVSKAVAHYNTKRRHQSLRWKSPLQFEREVENMPVNLQPKMRIYNKVQGYPQYGCE